MRRLALTVVVAVMAALLPIVQHVSNAYASSYSTAVLADSPTAYWRLGEASGTSAADASGNGHTGTLAGTVTLGTTGAIIGDSDKAMTFDGSSGVISTTLAMPTQNYTVEFWDNPAALGTDYQYRPFGSADSCCGSNGLDYAINASGNSIVIFRNGGAAYDFACGSAPSIGIWEYVAITVDATSGTKCYRNGAFVAGNPSATAMTVGSLSVHIGSSGDGGSKFNGAIDEFAIFGSALSASQISNHFGPSGVPPGAPTSVTATALGGNATVSWTAPTAGVTPTQSYTVTPSTGGVAAASQTVPSTATSVLFSSLTAGLAYTFTVVARNSRGTGGASTASGAVTPTVAAGGNPIGSGMGQYLYLNSTYAGLGDSAAFAHYAVDTQSTVGALSTWAVEAWFKNFGSVGTNGSGGFGILGGTSLTPSATVTAGISLEEVGNAATFVWPGGSANAPIPSPNTTFAHYLLSYDGTTVRGFVNGVLQASAVTASAATSAGPAGLTDYSDIRNLSLDEFRVSNTARYTSAFTPSTTKYSSDASTKVLWHFDDYPVRFLTEKRLLANQAPTVLSNIYTDSSSNGNNAEIVAWGGSYTYGDHTDHLYSLGQGITSPEQIGGGALEGLCPCLWHNSPLPVNDLTGEFYHTFNDFSIPGRGVALALNRTYSSSQSGVNGPFGYGWSHSYSTSVTFDGSGNPTINESNGSSVTFTKSGSNYNGPGRVLSTFVATVVGGVTTYKLTRTDKSALTFNATGQLTAIGDRNGYSTALAYDGSSRLSTVTDPASRTLTFAYDATYTARIDSVADSASPSTRTVTYTYDDANAKHYDLINVQDVAALHHAFTYDSSHRMLTMKDAKCLAAGGGCSGVVNHYDGNGRVDEQTDQAGREIDWSYVVAGLTQTTTITDANENVTVETYIDGMITTMTKAAGTALAATWTYGYDPITLGQTTITDPNGHSTAVTRDSSGNVTAKADALGRTTSYTYNAFNEVLTAADPVTTTTNTYDGNGNLTQTSRPLVGTSDHQVTQYAYDAGHAGDMITKTDAVSKVWSYEYDTYGNVDKITDPLSDKTTFSHDNVGRLNWAVTPKGNVTGGTPNNYKTSFTFNAYGDQLTATDPLSHMTTTTYDENHNVATSQDGNSHTTTYAYNFDNQQTQVTRADTSTLQTSYDSNGNVTQQIDGLSHTTRYQYDGLDHKTTMTSAYGDALAKTTTYTFDQVGNLLTVVDAFASPRTTTYAYDPADQLASIKYSDGTTPNVAYAYDSLGRRASMVDGTGTTSYVYDSLNRLTSQTDGASKVLGFTYDLKSQLTSIAYPNSVGSVTRTYDDAGRLKTILDWLSPGSRTAFTYTYDENSNITNLAYPNADSAAMTYNRADQMTQKTDTANSVTILSLGYTPDNIGLTTAEAAKSYTYDTINRVKTSTDNGGSTYTYDNADRLTQLALTGANTTTNVYNNADEIASLTVKNSSNVQVQKYTYTYDNNGNRIQQTDQSSNNTNVGYDQANRMISWSGGGHSAAYAYNGDGLRQSKTVDSVPTSDVWMPVGQSLPVIIVDMVGSTAAYYVTGSGGAPLEQVTGTTPYYVHSNMLGSTRKLTDASGAVQQNYDYDPYGNPISLSVSVVNPFQFAGQYGDSESGLYYMRARYYEPSSGQFVARDPAVVRTRQPYAYVADSPLNHVDPTGAVCVGVGYGVDLFGGTGFAGAGFLASFDVSLCSNGDVSALTSGGAFIGGNDGQGRPIGRSLVNAGGPHTAVGGFAGCGVHAFISPDATSTKRLLGPFQTVQGAIGRGTAVSLGASSSPGANVVQFGPPLGGGAGVGFGAEEMDTATTSWFTYNIRSGKWTGHESS